VYSAKARNGWFTHENSLQALNAIAKNYLTEEALQQWVSNYTITETTSLKKVGLILAGNIPAVGFHDVLTVFLSGHIACIKMSEKDAVLLSYMLGFLSQKDPRTKERLQVVDRLQGFDAVIATGSNNSALHFEQYFSKYPNIIRKNRNSIAILDGTETDVEMDALGQDIFQYFGLGCRSVSKVYLPKGYDITRLMAALDKFDPAMDHSKYKNNYDYNRSVYLLNRVDHFANDCVMALEHESLLSRIASIHFEYYEATESLAQNLLQRADEIQCISTKVPFSTLKTVALGDAQKPSLLDYADGVDTMQFLLSL
jgi:hypothetical protein